MSCSLSLAHLLLSTSLLCTCALPEGTGPRAAEASPPLLFPPFSFLCIPPARTPASLQTPPPFLHSDCAERGTSGFAMLPEPARSQLCSPSSPRGSTSHTACTTLHALVLKALGLGRRHCGSAAHVYGVCASTSAFLGRREGSHPPTNFATRRRRRPAPRKGGRGKHAGSKCTGFSSGSTLWFYNPSPCHEIQTPARARGQVCVGSARDAPSPWNQCAP